MLSRRAHKPQAHVNRSVSKQNVLQNQQLHKLEYLEIKSDLQTMLERQTAYKSRWYIAKQYYNGFKR
jgi:hypothetical protein